MLLIIFIISTSYGYNLVVDINPRAINRYLESFQSFYVQQLTDHEIPLIEKNRCLGKIAIASTTVSQVEIDGCNAIRQNRDYYLKITHLHARLHGEYNHNVFFVHQRGDFDLRIRDLNATIGPLVPVSIAGIPFIDNNVGCRISHSEDNFDVHGGILRVVAKRRLRQTLETDLENLLCDSFIDILDKGIRISLEALQLKTAVYNDEILSFALERPPILLDSGAIRIFHSGTSTRNNKNRFEIEVINDLNFDAVFHISQNLLSEALETVCRSFNRTISEASIHCQRISADFSDLGSNQNIILTVVFKENDKENSRNYNARLLHSSTLILYLRLKSEILAPKIKGTEFSRELFTIISDELRNNFRVALPLPKNLQLNNIQAVFNLDSFILAGNLK